MLHLFVRRGFSPKQDMAIEALLIGKSFNYPKGPLPRESHVAFKIPHVYDVTTKLYRQQAEVT